MTLIFPITDSVPLYAILKNLQETDELVRMRAICRKWKEIADYVSLHLLEPLGIRVPLEEASISVIRITRYFNHMMPQAPTPLRKVKVITEIKEISEIFTNPIHYINTLEWLGLTQKNALQQSQLKTIIINQSRKIEWAAKYGSLESFLYILNKHSPSPSELKRALLPACKSGNDTMIRTLIDLKVDPSKQHIVDETYLTACCHSHCYKGVKLLLKKGADPEQKNSKHEKPIAIAARQDIRIFELFKHTFETLNEKFGPDKDRSIAQYAAEGNNHEVILKLLSLEVPLDQPNIRGVTPLMISIQMDATETFYRLLECEASLESRCLEQLTPLDYAVMKENEIFLQVLLEKADNKQLIYGALKTALLMRHTKAINMISKSLGISTPIKYGSAIILGAFIGGLVAKHYFNSAE